MAKSKSKINVKYKILGASKEVTGSCHMLNINVDGKDYNIVVDLGQVQNQMKSMNELFEINKSYQNINWKSVDAIFCTHGHL